MQEISETYSEVKKIKIKQGIWRTYDATDGLSGQPNCLLQDGYGYLWIGTNVGLCRYDGQEFITYTTKDGLNSDYISALCLDNQGRLWIGTSNGICCFDGKKFTDNELISIGISSLCFDSQESLWIGTGKGLLCLDKNGFTDYTTDNGLSDNFILAICEDKGKRLWFGTEKGLSCFDGTNFRNYAFDEELPNNRIKRLCADNQGRIWILSDNSDGGVSCFDGKLLKKYTSKDGLVGPQNIFMAICNDHSGRMWFGGWDGVSCFDGERFKNYTIEDNVSGVHDILEDREGQMWFAHGMLCYLSCYDEKSIQFLTDQPNTWVADQDKKGRIWFNNISDIFVIQPNLASLEVEQRKISFPMGMIGLMVDSADHLWISPFDDGIYRYDSTDSAWKSAGGEVIDKPNHFIISDKIPIQNNAVPILEMKDGTIWFHMDAFGLLRFAPEHFMEGNAIESVDSHAYCMIRDSKGRFWMGNIRNQLSVWDKNELVTYGQENGFTNYGTMSLFEDDDKIWIGTTHGLWQYDGKQFIHYGEEYGLRDLYHWRHIAKDQFDQLWFATLGGVYRTDGKHFQWLTEDDGLPNNYVVRTIPQSDGSMIICTRGGIVRYRMTATIPPRVEIREVIADKVYQNPIKLELTTTCANLITISYHGLSLATKRMRYSYILEGYDEKWKETWARQARYENLPLGEYTFKVIAINRDLVPSESPATLKVRVIPDIRDAKISILQSEVNHLRREVGAKYVFKDIIGQSDAIGQVRIRIERAIESGLNPVVLITGETGTGKELVARAIHYNSSRANSPFRVYNISAIPNDLIDSELFGHRKGGFTGAIQDRIGYFEEANGGTLVLDEIGDMPLDVQSRLLGVLQDRRIKKIGENIYHDVDVRIIAMTNRNLEQDVKDNRFRGDLYYRLTEFQIHLPSLRERSEDIPILAEHFLKLYSEKIRRNIDGFASGVLEMLMSYLWPGNIRELENAVRDAMDYAIFEGTRVIQAHHFPSRILSSGAEIQDIASKNLGYKESLKLLQKRLIEDALRKCNGNHTNAAKILGMQRPNFIALIKHLGIKSDR